MFRFLKDKLKGVISGFSKGVEKGSDDSKAIDFAEADSAKPTVALAKPAVEVEKGESERGIGSLIREKLTTTRISPEKFRQLFWELEVAMLENNVAVEVVEKVKSDLETAIVGKPLPRGKVAESISGALKKSVEGLFEEPFELADRVKSKSPFVVVFVGINGSGKTTTIAKVAKMLKDKGLKVVLSASDTFRAASIEQLQHHADSLGVKMIKHSYGSDPAAVAFDAVRFAEAKGMDVVLVDTAGRLHSNTNLMDEVKKVVRVVKPDLKIFVGESITGNDCTEQAMSFDEAVGIDGIILAKADVDEKGGTAISVSYVTRKPILYLGTGQGYDDLELFDSAAVISGLGL
ncbi:signal recognition particle-docking protein FtsY [Candidatus Woesearchaeota archaeon]|nr:signal recognition particle-docking protein FtsY [Candidatus Woesearchaeota archaeon]